MKCIIEKLKVGRFFSQSLSQEHWGRWGGRQALCSRLNLRHIAPPIVTPVGVCVIANGPLYAL